jgi:hypothetical protein
MQQWWTFFSENLCRMRRADTGAGRQNVGYQQLRIIIGTTANDPALSITCVGFVWVGRASDNSNAALGIACESESRGCARNAAPND